jgi:hypothetical protein
MLQSKVESLLRTLAVVGALAAIVATEAARADDPVEEKNDAVEVSVDIDPGIAVAPELAEAVRAEAEQMTSLFNRDAAAAFADEGSHPDRSPHTLKLTFRAALISERLASSVGEAIESTGSGQKSMTFVNLTLDRQTGDHLEMADLFEEYGPDSPAFLAIQAYARDRLEVERAARLDIGDLPPEDYEWILDGTKEPALLSTYAVKAAPSGDKAGGLLLQFPPGQIGSQDEGSYELELPSLLFSEYLVPEYQDLFE